MSLYGFPQAVDAKIFQAGAELGGDFAFELDGNDGVPSGLGESEHSFPFARRVLICWCL